MQQTSKPTRKWYSFSLRTMLLAVIATGIWLGWLSHQARKQRQAVAWILSQGGEVWYENEVGESPNGNWRQLADEEQATWKWIPLRESWKPALLRDYEWNVVVVELNSFMVGDIAPLADLRRLEVLDLEGTLISDARAIASLTRLRQLNLDSTPVADLRPLTGLKNLETLELRGSKVVDIAPLAGLNQLQSLHLNGTAVSDVTPLSRLTKLTFLNLRCTDVADVTPLLGLQKLQHLELDETKIRDSVPLAQLASLRYLSMEETNLSYKQIQVIQHRLPNCTVEWSPAHGVGWVNFMWFIGKQFAR